MAPKKRSRAATKSGSCKRTKVEDSNSIVIDSDDESKRNCTTNGEEKAEAVKIEQKVAPIIHVPVDEYCPQATSHHVYIDEEGTIFDVALNQTNAGHNNNKFYRIQLIKNADDFRVFTRWGRVGVKGQNTTWGDGSYEDALILFQKKFKEKTGHKWDDRLQEPKPGKYVMLERDYEADDSQPPADDDKAPKDETQNEGKLLETESKLEKPVQRLMELIFNSKHMYDAMQDLDYDPSKMPLGKLSKRTITQAYETLKVLSALIAKADPADNSRIQELSNTYLSLIPHDFGRRRPPIISNTILLKKELTMLDSLSEMKVADEIMKSVQDSGVSGMHALDHQFQSLKLSELTSLDEGSKEYSELNNYLIGTCATTHSLKYGKVEIFRLEREGEVERYRKSTFAIRKESDKRLLWHGSRVTNFGGILSTGLRIAPPEAPSNGYMFSKGLYMADMSTKSANYCQSTSSGNEGLLLLCEAELGDPMLELIQANYSADELAKEKGAIATWGRGFTAPRQWKDASCVHKSLKGVRMPDITFKPTKEKVDGGHLLYNEYIAYDVAQVRLRYLFRVKMEHDLS